MRKLLTILLVLVFAILSGCSDEDSTASQSNDANTDVGNNSITESDYVNSVFIDLRDVMDFGYVQNDFIIEDFIEMESKGANVYFDNLFEYTYKFANGAEEFFSTYPDIRSQTQRLLEIGTVFYQNALIDECWKYMTVPIPEGVYQQPFFRGKFEHNRKIENITTYYSDEAWMILKDMKDGREYYEDTYTLKDGTAVDCIMFVITEEDKEFDGVASYAFFKYNEALCGLSWQKSTIPKFRGKYVFLYEQLFSVEEDVVCVTDKFPEAVKFALSKMEIVNASEYNEYEPFRMLHYKD